MKYVLDSSVAFKWVVPEAHTDKALLLRDVAYIDEVATDAIYMVGDDSVDFENPDDFAWVKEIIEAWLVRLSLESLQITLEKPDE